MRPLTRLSSMAHCNALDWVDSLFQLVGGLPALFRFYYIRQLRMRIAEACTNIFYLALALAIACY